MIWCWPKCVAGRPRDWEYAQAALDAGIAKGDVLLARIADLPVDDENRKRINDHLQAIACSKRRS